MSGKITEKVLKIEALDVDQLLLDPENPRLEGMGPLKDQLDLIKAMWREMAVSEVALSIAANGFFEEEPLFAIPGPTINCLTTIVLHHRRQLTLHAQALP